MKLRSLKELGPLKAQMERLQREQAREEARARELAHELAREQRRARNLFASAVGPVYPLPAHGRAPVSLPPPEPVPLQRALDEQAAVREAWSDEIDVESLLDTDGELSFRRPQIAPDVLKRLRRGQWVIQAQVDLHGLRREEAREVLAEFLRDAMQRGLRCVRVVHGKGLGSPGKAPVLKGKVRGWLVQKECVMAFVQARASEGGHGALVVLLRGGTPA